MKTIKIFKSEMGYSLVELLVAAGILLAALVAVTQLNVFSGKSLAGTEARGNAALLSKEISDRLRQPGICNQSIMVGTPFQFAAAQSTSLNTSSSPIEFNFGNLKIKDQTSAPNYNLKIVKSGFYAARQVANTPAGANYYHVRYGIIAQNDNETEANRTTSGALQLNERPVADLILKTDLANNVLSCDVDYDSVKCNDPICRCGEKSQLFVPTHSRADAQGCVDPNNLPPQIWQLTFADCKCGTKTTKGTYRCANKDGSTHSPDTDCGEKPPQIATELTCPATASACYTWAWTPWTNCNSYGEQQSELHCWDSANGRFNVSKSAGGHMHADDTPCGSPPNVNVKTQECARPEPAGYSCYCRTQGECQLYGPTDLSTAGVAGCPKSWTNPTFGNTLECFSGPIGGASFNKYGTRQPDIPGYGSCNGFKKVCNSDNEIIAYICP